MDAFFADDSRQRDPSRRGIGPLVAIGGVHVPEEAIKPLEADLEQLCEEFGFPPGEPFKWSPGRDLWMHDQLIEDARERFFLRALGLAHARGVQVCVVVEDTDRGQATAAPTPEDDVVQLFLERADNHVRMLGRRAIVIADRPGGDRAAEERFLGRCIETVRQGRAFVQFRHLALVITTPAKLVRLLQLADVVTSCTVSFVGGHVRYAEPVFDVIRPMLRTELGRIGGVGLKIQPDLRSATSITGSSGTE